MRYLAAMTTPSYPAAPSNTYTGGGVRPAAPGSVKGAFLIYVVAALLAIVGAVLLVTSKTWDAAIAASAGKANASGITAESLANAVKIATVVVTVIIVGLYLLFAFKMRAGRNWARVVLTVLSALSIANTARSSSSITVNNQVYSAAGSQVFSWLGAILAILAIVLMFLPASNAYFTASKAARQRR
jgi:preprotein translocase subunit SecG